MLSTEENDSTARLDVERRRGMLDGMVDTHDDTVIADGALLGKRENGAADLDGLEEGSSVCHCDVVVC